MSFRRPAYWRTDRFGEKHEPRIEWREVAYFDKYDDEFVGYEGVIKVGNTTKPERFWITSLPNGKYTMQFFQDRPATPLPGRKDGWNLGAREYFGLSQAKDSALAFIDAFDRGKDRRGIQRFKKNPEVGMSHKENLEKLAAAMAPMYSREIPYNVEVRPVVHVATSQHDSSYIQFQDANFDELTEITFPYAGDGDYTFFSYQTPDDWTSHYDVEGIDTPEQRADVIRKFWQGHFGKAPKATESQLLVNPFFPAHWETETWVISPDSLYWSAVDMVDPVEADAAHTALVEASEQVADAIRDEYSGTGHGIGSSDRFNFARAVVQSAGLKPKTRQNAGRKSTRKTETLYLVHVHEDLMLDGARRPAAVFGLASTKRKAIEKFDKIAKPHQISHDSNPDVMVFKITFNPDVGEAWIEETP